MIDWQLVCLAVMAVSLAIMAAIQIGLIIAGLKIARQLGAAIDDLRQEIKPLSDKVQRIADDVGRTTALLATQVERLDQTIAATTAQVDDAVSLIRGLMGGPLRQGAAFFTALRAVFSWFQARQADRSRASQRERGHAREDDEGMFVG